MAYITNDGARLIERARTEGKSIVFGSVRMNTIYKSDPYSLVQQTDEWFGENHGSVVGCLSHVSVDEGSKVCDSKLAVQCNDNSESWKSLGIYAHLDGEEGEVLFACESIENGEYKDVTIVELPVTLDGVVVDFGLSEGGSGGGGGGGGVPANMMTTDTDQTGLSCTKQWSWENYIGGGTVDFPQDGGKRVREYFSICNIAEVGNIPLSVESDEDVYYSKDGSWHSNGWRRLEIASDAVRLNGSFASWSDIINAAKIKQGFDHAITHVGEGGRIEIGGILVSPNDVIKIGEFGKYGFIAINNESQIAGIHASNCVLDISAAVFDSGVEYRVSGITGDGIPFDPPLPLVEGQEIYIHWTLYENNI